jgi:hypothetical protein
MLLQNIYWVQCYLLNHRNVLYAASSMVVIGMLTDGASPIGATDVNGTPTLLGLVAVQ